jgi:hypothetical protein
MKNPTSKSLRLNASARQRSALMVAVCAIVLGLAAASLPNLRAQSQSRPGTEQVKALSAQQPAVASTASESVIASWPNEGRKRLTYDDYLRSLKGNERLTARVLSTGPSGNGNPQSVIVIYGGDGHIVCCIGRASACKELSKN